MEWILLSHSRGDRAQVGHLKAVLEESHAFGQAPYREKATAVAMEVRIIRAWVDDSIRLEGHENRIDPDRWRPLIISFCQFYGLGPQLKESALARIPESSYRPAAHMS